MSGVRSRNRSGRRGWFVSVTGPPGLATWCFLKLGSYRVWVIGALVSGAIWNKQEILFNGAGVVIFSDIVCVDRNYASVCSSPLDCVCACVCV